MERLNRLGDWLRQNGAKALNGAAGAVRSVLSSIQGRLRTKSSDSQSLSKDNSYFVPEPVPGAGPTEPQTIEGMNGSAPLEPGQRIYAIGDVHGRADLLEDLLTQIETDCEAYPGKKTIIFLGDYIDRGFQSRQVIDVILSDRLSGFEVHCLKGNHEEAMLQFLASADFGPRWAAYGGRETLVSYGVRPPRNQNRMEEWQEVHASLVAALPLEHEKFLMQLLPSVRIGQYGFVHAGLKPGIPFEEQQERDLLWIRDEFLNHKNPLDVIVVHGHTPADKPYWDHRRINVDTGAYISGRLTAVRLEADSVSFLSTNI